MVERHINGDSSSGEFDGKNRVEEQEQEYDARNHSVSRPARQSSMTPAERIRRNENAKLANPLAGYSFAELKNQGATYVKKYQIGDEEDIRAFELGACLAQDPSKYESVQGLTGAEMEVLRKEFTNRWSQPKLMYLVIILCSTCAAVQGMGV